ncbi:uncharacterized protein LOC144446888 [Glandiceps talaboti]
MGHVYFHDVLVSNINKLAMNCIDSQTVPKSAITDEVLLFLPVCVKATTLVGTFNMEGVTGTMTFSQASYGDTTTITVNLDGLESSNTYQWEIRSLPVFYDRSDKCADGVLGTVLHDLSSTHAPLTPSLADGDQYTDNSIQLTKTDSISGRSVVLDNGSHRICTTISTNHDMITAVALFQAPVAGMVVLRQLNSDSASDTTVYSDLFYIDGTTGSTYEWAIYSNLNGIDYDITHTARCSATTAIYNPGNSDNTGCSTSAQDSCQIGNLSGKLGDVDVTTNRGSAIQMSVDTNLPLSGSNSVVGKTLVVKSGNEMIACAYITNLASKTVTAVFNTEDVTGEITFTQASPLDSTTVHVALNNLQNLATYYHVHQYPVAPRITADDSICSSAVTGGHLNPYDIDKSASPVTGTDDEYEVGDLSGKYGTLSGTDFDQTYTDSNLPLFGSNSIVGRSVVIHKSDNSRWICANIGYPTSTKTAIAVFSAPIVGQMMMKQDANDPFSDTSVFVNVADGTQTTSNHNWHVHINAIGDDYLSTESRCSSAAGHYNPYGANLDNPGYSTECNTENPHRCELGDLSNKLGQIDIISDLSSAGGKYFYTDSLLPLSGITSVLGRSIVIHDAESAAARYACADIYEMMPVVSRANNWSDGPVTGTIEIKQKTLQDQTEVDIDVSGLQSNAGGYHIHVLPILQGVESPCGSSSVLGHFNPFGIVAGPVTGTNDMYEIGDLSGKFGLMTDLTSLTATYMDSNLPMMGPQSANGRSIVIHKNDESGSRWVCSDLTNVLDANDFEVQVVASVDSSDLIGDITLKQVHYEDGLLGDTSILVAVSSQSGSSQSGTYTWSVNTGYGDDPSCTGTGSVYNPYQVNTQGSYDTICSQAYQSHCQVGDLSGRHGDQDPEGDRVLYTDTNLPLVGHASVIGRTIKMTSSVDSTSCCMTLYPTSDSGAMATLGFATLQSSFDPYNFRQTVAAFMNIDMWRVVASRTPTETISGCQSVTFWFVGENSQSVKSSFEAGAMSDNNDALGIYAPTDDCPMDDSAAESAHLSLITMATVLLLVAMTTV